MIRGWLLLDVDLRTCGRLTHEVSSHTLKYCYIGCGIIMRSLDLGHGGREPGVRVHSFD